MGLTETAAKAEGVEYEKVGVPVGGVRPRARPGPHRGRDQAAASSPTSRRVLGCGIVGVGAGDLIAETVLALEMGADAEDIALTIHPHPTLSETVAFAAEMADGSITDLMPPRRLAPAAEERSAAPSRGRATSSAWDDAAAGEPDDVGVRRSAAWCPVGGRPRTRRCVLWDR